MVDSYFLVQSSHPLQGGKQLLFAFKVIVEMCLFFTMLLVLFSSWLDYYCFFFPSLLVCDGLQCWMS